MIVRPKWEDVPLCTINCSCGGFLTSREQTRAHWQLGHFDYVKETTIDCRSEEGITIGLIDAIISICRILSPRLEMGTTTDSINEALMDLSNDEDMKNVIAWTDKRIVNTEDLW